MQRLKLTWMGPLHFPFSRHTFIFVIWISRLFFIWTRRLFLVLCFCSLYSSVTSSFCCVYFLHTRQRVAPSFTSVDDPCLFY